LYKVQPAFGEAIEVYELRETTTAKDCRSIINPDFAVELPSSLVFSIKAKRLLYDYLLLSGTESLSTLFTAWYSMLNPNFLLIHSYVSLQLAKPTI
jgi:hypothetical protein